MSYERGGKSKKYEGLKLIIREWKGIAFSVGALIFVCYLIFSLSGSGSAVPKMSDEDFWRLCQWGTPEQVQSAIKAGANVNARDKDGRSTALMNAVQVNPNPEVITLLIKAGAEVNAQNEIGETALMYAFSPEIVVTLIKAGADVNIKTSDGSRAIDYAGIKKLRGTEAYRMLEKLTR